MRFPLALALLCGCTGEVEPDTMVDIDFRAVFSDSDADCTTEHEVGTRATAMRVADARMFISRVQVFDTVLQGWVPVEGIESDWHHDGVWLLDFEDGSGSCADSGNGDLNRRIQGTVRPSEYRGLRFDVGLPHELNHLDSATAPSPLNAQGMFWVWAAGYKFVRVDLTKDGEPPVRWNVHIGSSGCSMVAPTIPPEGPCERPNRATITLSDTPVEGGEVVVDLAELVAGVDVLSNVEDSPPGCMSNPAEPEDCSPVFSALGLDYDTGECVDDCAGQRVFSVGPQ